MLFSITFGFFVGGYSATWDGTINKLRRKAAQNNEAVDLGILYGLLNGARGIGYMSGGLAGAPLIKAEGMSSSRSFSYRTIYGTQII